LAQRRHSRPYYAQAPFHARELRAQHLASRSCLKDRQNILCSVTRKGTLITLPTFGRPHFPVYCAHCYFANHAPLNKNGSPMFVYEPPSDPGHEPCGIIIEKKRRLGRGRQTEGPLKIKGRTSRAPSAVAIEQDLPPLAAGLGLTGTPWSQAAPCPRT
jgi:hypothetical protein